MPSPTDLGALLHAQRRLLEACAQSGRILADAAQGCAERQATIARLALRDIVASAASAERAGEPAELLHGRVDRIGHLFREVGEQIGAMQRIVVEAQLAMLDALRRAFEPEVAPAGEAGARNGAATPVEPAAETAAAPVPASTRPSAEAAESPAERVRARRGRRAAAEA